MIAALPFVVVHPSADYARRFATIYEAQWQAAIWRSPRVWRLIGGLWDAITVRLP